MRSSSPSTSSKIRTLLLAAALLVGVAACAIHAPRSRPHPGMERIWHEFRKLPLERALAVSGDPEGPRWVAGMSGGHQTRAAAESAAIAECRKRRKKARFRFPCQLYGVDDEIVWTSW